jgi:hypothetical protein
MGSWQRRHKQEDEAEREEGKKSANAAKHKVACFVLERPDPD